MLLMMLDILSLSKSAGAFDNFDSRLNSVARGKRGLTVRSLLGIT